jgi:hypothetical protein
VSVVLPASGCEMIAKVRRGVCAPVSELMATRALPPARPGVNDDGLYFFRASRARRTSSRTARAPST